MLRQKSTDAGTGPAAGPSRRKPAKRSSADETFGKDSVQKRRRRAFSCLSCQKLKCRCEYDSGAQGCHRCQTLRIVCSLGGQADTATNAHAEPSSPGIEERLRRHEEALQEIKAMIEDLKSGTQTPAHTIRSSVDHFDREDGAPVVGGHDPPDLEYLANPVDRGSKSAPIVVLREISQHVALGYRRLLGHENVDLIQLQLLDDQTASELIELFIKHQGHMLLVRNYDDLRRRSPARQVSAFLHSVCCLIGIVYREDVCGTPLHRRIYEQVRITLGQAMLVSPLDLDDLNAMFIMSNNANTPSGQGADYIDSWLLSGYCAKQAMLSIYFTQIVDRLKRGNSTIEDHRAMHLWSTICLHHLHWAATTGRPSIITKGYINQCNILLSFYQATMQDGMLVAEIMLYSILHQKILQQSYPSNGGECEEFLAWKQRWKHLLALSTSSKLRIGYHAACLILAVRALEKTGDALGSVSLLSTENTPIAANSTGPDTNGQTPTSTDHHDPKCDEKGMAGDNTSRPSADTDSASDILRTNTCKYAKLVIETFVDMPLFLMDATSTCTCLCIGYCALVLAHYDASQSHIPDAVSLRLITRIDQWIQTSPGKAWSYKYGALARQKLETRINMATASSGPRIQTHQHGRDQGQGQDQGRANVANLDREDTTHDQPNLSNLSQESDTSTQRPPDGHATVCPTDDLLTPTGHPLDQDTSLPSFDLDEQAIFPSMEGFFGGGFLDFMK
ncbi:hypothetical protein F5Y19DRAFT_142475 [Xylariaceae sp. FL1651]|nr:hypothetical protein F5Y19DRAFT_142475 [Xylariaceae sp. FL1651]